MAENFSKLLIVGLIHFSFYSLQGQEPTYADIQPIIERHCVNCHQDGQIGPMPLTTFEEVQAYGEMIKYVTSIGYMPPYLPSGRFGHFQEERRMPQEEKEKLIAWIETGMKRDSSMTFTQENSSMAKESEFDACYSMADSFQHYGVYYDQFRVFIVPTQLERDTFVSAIEFIPGNARIVKNATVSIAVDSAFNKWNDWDPAMGYFSFGELGFVPFESRWYHWYPTKPRSEYNNGKKFLPKGAILIFHIHYGPSDKPVKDRSAVRLKFCNTPEYLSRTTPFIHTGVYSKPVDGIGADEKLKIHARLTIPTEISLTAIMPHAHFLCRSWEIYSKSKRLDMSSQLLIIHDWDFKWRQMYRFNRPFNFSPSDEIHVLTSFDNTENNILNPNEPPKPMTWGKRMFNENMLVYFEYELPISNSSISLFKNASLISKANWSLKISMKEAHVLTAAIYSPEGELLMSLISDENLAPGNYELPINMESFSHGNYVLQITNGAGAIVDRHWFAYVNTIPFGVME